VRSGGAGNRDDAHEGVQAGEVGRVGGKQGQVFGDGGSRDHQVGDPPARLTAGGDDRRRYPAVDTGRLGVERQRVELALGALQDLQASRSLRMLVIQVLLVIAAHLMRAGRQLGEGNGADRHLVGELGGIDPPAGDEDAGIQQARPGKVTAHTGLLPHAQRRDPDQPGTRPGRRRERSATSR
jgi:hypothetical protein